MLEQITMPCKHPLVDQTQLLKSALSQLVATLLGRCMSSKRSYGVEGYSMG